MSTTSRRQADDDLIVPPLHRKKLIGRLYDGAQDTTQYTSRIYGTSVYPASDTLPKTSGVALGLVDPRPDARATTPVGDYRRGTDTARAEQEAPSLTGPFCPAYTAGSLWTREHGHRLPARYAAACEARGIPTAHRVPRDAYLAIESAINAQSRGAAELWWGHARRALVYAQAVEARR